MLLGIAECFHKAVTPQELAGGIGMKAIGHQITSDPLHAIACSGAAANRSCAVLQQLEACGGGAPR